MSVIFILYIFDCIGGKVVVYVIAIRSMPESGQEMLGERIFRLGISQ